MTTPNYTLDQTTYAITKNGIVKNEGNKEYPYLDSNGNTTIAVGLHTPNQADFVSLNLNYVDKDKGINRPATTSEKRQGWKQMQDQKTTYAGKYGETPAKEYLDATKLRMSEANIDATTKTAINTRARNLRTAIGVKEWGQLAPGQKAALIDIEYGNGNIRDSFPGLMAAANTGDQARLAYESFFWASEENRQRPNKDRLIGNIMGLTGLSQTGAKIIVDKYIETDKLAGARKKAAQQGVRDLIGDYIEFTQVNKPYAGSDAAKAPFKDNDKDGLLNLFEMDAGAWGDDDGDDSAASADARTKEAADNQQQEEVRQRRDEAIMRQELEEREAWAKVQAAREAPSPALSNAARWKKEEDDDDRRGAHPESGFNAEQEAKGYDSPSGSGWGMIMNTTPAVLSQQVILRTEPPSRRWFRKGSFCCLPAPSRFWVLIC